MKKLGTICFVLFLIGAGASRSAHSFPQDAAIRERKSAAVTLLRVINTAKMEHQDKQKRFASFATLVESGLVDATGKRYAAAWNSVAFDRIAVAEPLAGYTMHFIVDGEGRSYAVALCDKPAQDAFATDERGLIYEAKPL